MSDQESISQNDRQRPGCITAFVVLTAIGVAVSLFLALATDALREFHPSAPAATVVWCAMGVAMAVGFWKMKRWAFIVYAAIIVLAYIVHPLLIGGFGARVVPGLIVQVIIFGFLLRYRSRMS